MSRIPGCRTGSAETPIRIVVPFAPGGSPDIVARFLATHMAQSLGRQLFVENRPGAGGTMAAESAADAEPNGTTLLMTTVSSTRGTFAKSVIGVKCRTGS